MTKRPMVKIGGHEIPIISPAEAAKLLDGAVIVTPQFHREPGAPPPSCRPTDWTALRTMPGQALREMGLRPWNKAGDPEDGDTFGGGELWLFPGEWYEHIPNGFEIVSIAGERETFQHGVTDDDIRFGCLAYGIVTGNPTEDA